MKKKFSFESGWHPAGSDHFVFDGPFDHDWHFGHHNDHKKFVFGTHDDDVLNGSSRSEFIFGFGGDDEIHGNGGKDFISGGHGDDLIDGGADKDSLFGDKGNDGLFGGADNDELSGGKGNDYLDGGAGKDSLRGGPGNDKFVIHLGTGHDTIEDFECNDSIDLRDFGFASGDDVIDAFQDFGHKTVLILPGGNKLVLEGVHKAELKADQFIVSDTQKGPISSATPYLVPVDGSVSFVSLLTTGDAVGFKDAAETIPWRMAGTPDGLGAFDNGDGTFTVLMNHEFSPTAGIPRDHGGTGSFISKLVIDKASLKVLSGDDLIQTVHLYDPGTGDFYNPVTDAGHPVSGAYQFDRLCSADLAAETAFYNPETGLGYNGGRIFMNGEEDGPPFSTHYGLAFAHFASGSLAGQSFELATLGKLAHENVVADPYSGDKTIIATMDDGPTGTSQVYFYYGDKQASGTALEKAGLTGGHLFGLKVAEIVDELIAVDPLGSDDESTFTLVDLGDVSNKTGAQLDADSEAAGVTSFLRPEDGAWEPINHDRFYFATTDAFNAPSRLWAVDFNDALHPELGGTIKLLLDGTEGQQMLDNLAVNSDGKVILNEDVGNNVHNGKVWEYDPFNDQLTLLAQHDPNRFDPNLNGPGVPGPDFITQDEESSGVLDVTDILGSAGQHAYLIDVQAHNTLGGELVQGGQLMVMYQDLVTV